MSINADKPRLWKADINHSVDFYNNWFMRFAPRAYRETRKLSARDVKSALKLTGNLSDISTSTLSEHPGILPILRMSTAPPIARDRLIGLASVSSNLVRSMELRKRLPPNMPTAKTEEELHKIGVLIRELVDIDIFTWLQHGQKPQRAEIERAATIVADRLCGAQTDPIIRNAQEARQLACIRDWLEKRGYRQVKPRSISEVRQMDAGTFAFHLNVPVFLEGGQRRVNIPVDVAIMPKGMNKKRLPILVECKSAGDFTNTNKRRKEEAIKIAQLRNNYGKNIRFVLFLCGYFDSGYLGYEAAEGLDWIWEHRIEDLSKLGV